jgi:hypothetical protein
MRTLFGACAVAVAAVLAFSSAVQAGGGLQAVPTPNVTGADFNQIDGTASLGTTNAWAVGFARNPGTLLFHTLAEHWDGTRWSIVPTAAVPNTDDTQLHAITFRTATDGWTVGEDSTVTTNGETAQGLIEHWNGTAWSRVPSPPDEPVNTRLRAVSAVSANDVWAVGDAVTEAVIEHWNGTSWSLVPSPVSARLLGVSALSAGNVWAVGSTPNRHPGPVIEHWNGATWTQVSQPVSGFDATLNSISATGANDIWAVGQQNLNQTVTEHWNGTSWTLVPSPSVTTGTAQDTLTGVVALSPTDAWAVGETLQPTVNSTLALHWDGTSWQIVPSADPGAGSNAFRTITGSVPGQPVWAGGFSIATNGHVSTLIETATG